MKTLSAAALLLTPALCGPRPKPAGPRGSGDLAACERRARSLAQARVLLSGPPELGISL